MKKYRVWMRDITLQSTVIEAIDEKRARQAAEVLVNEGEATFEQDIMEQSFWEVTSVEPINE